MSIYSDDRSYFAARARGERHLAECASNPAVAEIHRQLAQEYERKSTEEAVTEISAIESE